MLKLFWGAEGRAFRKFVLGNAGALKFLAPKLTLIVLILLLPFAALLAASILFIEIGLSVVEYRREVGEGFTTKRASRVALVNAVLAVCYVSLTFLFFSIAAWWLALLLSIVALGVFFTAYLLASLFGLFKDMRGAPSTEDSALFQQVREMRDLEDVAKQLRWRLLSAKTLDKRRNLKFYLGWAETYRGHYHMKDSAWEKAASFYKEALRFDSANLGARVSLTVCYLRLDEFELALRQIEKAVATFNGYYRKVAPRFDKGIWHWHRNEVSSEYEQNSGIFQLCGMAVALLKLSSENSVVKEVLMRELIQNLVKIQGRTEDEMWSMLARKGGTSPGALGLLAAGPYRTPAAPLDLLSSAFCLPLLPIQTVELESAA
ncbi:MAG: hypothetical protein HXX08_01650 [Chloroflexi bacterium]|uniref:Tetratricopeptide repeat protein n=1 Tax=Candidatus Chlorohelix allophototropha TaxID=3003348 RepID=A0A8T7LZW7_9CHLR|nr:hypothetical protein [Chloroflexota bacterium]WJW66452.1 hypothetical protein OZ401_002250 [Chloroflexota bacterium L227-S17]